MDSDQPAPTRLKIVAGLFFFHGVCAILRFIVGLFYNSICINLGVVNVFIGWGLIRYSRGWRTCALVFLWIRLIAIPIISVLLICSSGPVYFHVLGRRIAPMSEVYAHAFGAAFLALSVWEYHVLTRPGIRKLFGVQED